MIQVQPKFERLKIFPISVLVIFSVFLANTKVNSLNSARLPQRIEVNSQKSLDNTKFLEDPPSFRPENFKLSFFSSLLVAGTGVLILAIRLLCLDSEE